MPRKKNGKDAPAPELKYPLTLLESGVVRDANGKDVLMLLNAADFALAQRMVDDVNERNAEARRGKADGISVKGRDGFTVVSGNANKVS